MLETRGPGSPEFQKSPCSGGSMEYLLDPSEPRGRPCGNGPGRIRGARAEPGLTGLGFSRQGSFAMEVSPRIPGMWARIVAAVIAGLVLSGCQEQGEESAQSAADKSANPAVLVRDGVAVLPGRQAGWRSLDDPGADGWETEVIHDLLKKKLGKLAELIVAEEFSAELQAPLVAEEIESSALVPSDLETISNSSGVMVRRGKAAVEMELKGSRAFASALQVMREALGGKPQARRCAFKVVTIEREGTRVAAGLVVESVRSDETKVVEQHAEWSTSWRLHADGGDIELMTVLVERFEQSEARRTLFSECSESILGGNESYRKQVIRGYPHWLERIQDTRQMTLLGTPGVALGDVNGDGLDDLYLCQPGGLPNRLYLQQADGSLRDTTEESGTGWVESSRSALLVDLDNDGDQDLAVATYARLVLARNDGRGRFEVAAVLEIGIGAMGISAVDFDDDRDLDLYVCHYSRGDLDLEAGATVIGSGGQFVYHDANNAGRNYFFRNEAGGTEWDFRDVTEECGLDVNNRRFSLAAAWEDYDNDGDQDLYVANDFGRNNLYRNEGGSFIDIAAEVQGEDRASGMSVSWGDINRDGLMDLYVANMFSAAGNRIAPQTGFSPGSSEEVRDALLRFARGNTLLVQEKGRFADVSEPLGVTMGRWAWSSMFADLNNDGWDDLLVANGYITTPDTGDL